MEQDVLDDINIRTEVLIEMYQDIAQKESEKPDEQQVQALLTDFKNKSNELRT